MTYTKINSTSFRYLKIFPRMNNKKIRKGGPRGPSPISLRSKYSSSNWFHSNTSNSRHIFNTNSYDKYVFNYFYSENNIKLRFLKSWVLKFQNSFRHSLSTATRWNKSRWYQQRLYNNETAHDFQKTTLINNYYIYS